MRTKFALMLPLLSISLFAFGQDTPIQSHAYPIIRVPPAGGHAARTAPFDTGLITIFNTFATAYPKGTYLCCDLSYVQGPQFDPKEPEIWVAVPFIPNANHTVNRIVVAASLFKGTNKLVAGFYDDDGGVPGTLLKSWSITDLPPTGSCCVVESINDDAGLPVIGGKQYWVALGTDASDADTHAAWNSNDTDIVDAKPVAFYCKSGVTPQCGDNEGWHAYTSPLQPALAVLGKQ